jgi:uncharacterized protein YukJ
MPIPQYSVLRATPRSGKLSSDRIPHYLIEAEANGSSWQIAVNVESSDGSEVLFYIDENFTPPDAEALDSLAQGATSLAGADANPAVDYLRSKVNNSPLITREQLTPLPLPGHSNADQLKNAVVQFLNQSVADPDATVYAWGSRYTDGTLGIHNIHMNQGNPVPGSFATDNGIWQDGLLVFSLPASGTYAAVFLAFQDESWDTDENGNPL